MPPRQGFQLSRSGSEQSGAGRSGAQLQDAGTPAGSRQRSRGVSKRFAFLPATLTNSQGIYARASGPAQQQGSSSSSHSFAASAGHAEPQSCHLLPLAAASIPAGASPASQNQRCGASTASPELPNAQKMTAEGPACLQPFLGLLSAGPWFPSQAGSESSGICCTAGALTQVGSTACTALQTGKYSGKLSSFLGNTGNGREPPSSV